MLCTGDVEYLKRKSIKYLPYVCVLINNLSHQYSAVGITKKIEYEKANLETRNM